MKIAMGEIVIWRTWFGNIRAKVHGYIAPDTYSVISIDNKYSGSCGYDSLEKLENPNNLLKKIL